METLFLRMLKQALRFFGNMYIIEGDLSYVQHIVEEELHKNYTIPIYKLMHNEGEWNQLNERIRSKELTHIINNLRLLDNMKDSIIYLNEEERIKLSQEYKEKLEEIYNYIEDNKSNINERLEKNASRVFKNIKELTNVVHPQFK